MTDEYEAVFWDIGGVILQMESVTKGHQAFVQELVGTYESPLSTGEALETWRDVLGEYFAATEGTNYRPASEGYTHAIDAIVTADPADIDWQSLFTQVHEEHAAPNPGAVETIERLAETPLHVGVISDVDHEEGQRILENIGVRTAFNSFTSSEEVGRKKPDQAMFETALGKADVDAGRSIMIGDRYSHDMKGGREAGMTTVAYGADDGPAVDYHVENLTAVLPIVGLER